MLRSQGPTANTHRRWGCYLRLTLRPEGKIQRSKSFRTQVIWDRPDLGDRSPEHFRGCFATVPCWCSTCSYFQESPQQDLSPLPLSLPLWQAAKGLLSNIHIALAGLSVMMSGFLLHTVGPRLVWHPWAQWFSKGRHTESRLNWVLLVESLSWSYKTRFFLVLKH